MEKILKGKKFFAFTKGLACFTGILLVMLAVFSCNNVLVGDGGSLIIAVPGARAASASSYTIELTGTNGTTQSKTVAGGTTAQFDDLDPDTYTISVKGTNADVVVLYGTSSATVSAGATASAMVKMGLVANDLSSLRQAITAGDIVYIGSDIEVKESLQISNTVTILPAYQDVTLKNLTSSYLINVSTGGALTVGGGEYTITLDGNENSSYVISAGAGCSVHLNENSIITKGFRGVNLGGGTSDSSLSLAGGVITGNQDSGVYLGTKSQFNMSSGSITGNYTGVSVSADSQFSMTGGSIFGNTINGVDVIIGEFTMAGGSITGNTREGVSVSGQFTMENGSITGNSARGVSISSGGVFTMTGGSISGNTTGGVYIYTDATFTMENGVIEENTNNGVFVSGEFTMQDGKISGNTAGGVSIYADATFTMEGGSIEKNNRSGSGGGVSMVKGASFEMKGGVIKSNSAENYGDGVYVSQGSFNMSGSAVIASNNDVYLESDTSMNVSGSLTGGDAVATITPAFYTPDTQVLKGDAFDLIPAVSKFAVTLAPGGTEWFINTSGYLQQVTQ